MLAEGADLGIAFDGDGDRIGVVDAEGEIVWPDQLLLLMACDVLERTPGATIVADVKSSHVLFDGVRAGVVGARSWRLRDTCWCRAAMLAEAAPSLAR